MEALSQHMQHQLTFRAALALVLTTALIIGPGGPVLAAQPASTYPTPRIALDTPLTLALKMPDRGVILPHLVLPRPAKVAYLTFDDGPNPGKTEAILAILRRERIRATFFVIGKQVEIYPETLEEVIADGHELANHTYDHDYRAVYSSTEAFRGSLDKNAEIIARQRGRLWKTLRAPGGSPNMPRETKRRLAEQGYRWYDWDISTADTAASPPATSEQMLTFVTKQLEHRGSEKELIVLMHDGATASPTVKALPGVIRLLRDAGYGFLPLSYIQKPGGEAEWRSPVGESPHPAARSPQ